jgi:hypothetical protein
MTSGTDELLQPCACEQTCLEMPQTISDEQPSATMPRIMGGVDGESSQLLRRGE